MADTELNDPLGPRITFHDHTWYGHVVKGHPDMRTHRNEAERAVASPSLISFSDIDPDCRLYYAPTAVGRMMSCVVADVVKGIVKTAYRTTRTKGLVEWSSQTPLEGLVDGAYWYHYDVRDDVLYLRLVSHRDSRALGEEDDQGMIVLREEGTGQVIGLTVVNWWRRFGDGQLPDSIREIQRHIEPWAGKVAA